jgi:hypothetical protein
VDEILHGTSFADNAKPGVVQNTAEGGLTYAQPPGTVFAKTHAI